MNRNVIGVAAIVSTVVLAAVSFGRTTFTGYSGAPGSRGNCASSCHGTSGGTIQVAGFPEQYVPGQVYTVAVSHSGGSSIRQFNGSCRVGSGSQNAGVIAAGTGTATYTVTGETNGIHFSSANRDQGTFTWTTPQSGAGNVTLYISGLQGGESGQNTELILTASEVATGVDQPEQLPDEPALMANFPNPFNSSTKIRFSMPASGQVSINIYSLLGQKVTTLFEGNIGAGVHSLTWEASRYQSGVYICELKFNGGVFRRGITLLK